MIRRNGREPIDAVRDDETVARLRAEQAAWIDREIALAKDLAVLDAKRAFLYERAASVEELAARIGYVGFRARELALAGHALNAEPAYETYLRKNEIVFAALVAVGQLYRDPEFWIDEADDWVHAVRFKRLKDLRKLVRIRIEELRQRRTVRAWTAFISEETREDLEECRVVASKKAGRPLTRGQLLTVLSTFYRIKNDIRVKPARARRMPPTVERPHDRTVPADAVREVRARSGGYCEFGGCGRIAMHLCHIEPHRHGGSREALNLVDGCRIHHRQFDDHEIRFLAFTDDKRPVFIVEGSNEILSPKPPPDDPVRSEPEEWLLKATGQRVPASSEPRQYLADGPRPGGAGFIADRAVANRIVAEWRAAPPARKARSGAPRTTCGSEPVECVPPARWTTPHGLGHHDPWHGGQIALLRRLLSAR